MNKSVKVLSLALLLSASFVSANEVSEEVATPVKSVEVTEAAESIESLVKKALDETVKSMAEEAGQTIEITEEAVKAIVDKVEKSSEADKKAYIKANIKSLIASLSESTEASSEQVVTEEVEVLVKPVEIVEAPVLEEVATEIA
jgi:hypothetical protein